MTDARPRPPRPLSRRTVVAGLAAAWHPIRVAAGNEAAPPAVDGAAWEPAEPMPLAGSELAATVLDRVIYVAGGFGMESELLALDTRDTTWSRRAAMPEPRHHVSLAALDGMVYLAGGHDTANRAVDTFWRYDPAGDAWETLAPLPQGPRGALGLAALAGALYVVGGSSGDLGGPATADCAAFDPATGAWLDVAPMPTAREHLAVGTAAGRIVAIGGRDGGNVDPRMAAATEALDPETGQWEVRSPLPVPRSGMGVATTADTVVVLGGEGEAGAYPDVHRYDSAADRWVALRALPVAKHGLAAAVVDGTLYGIGGSTRAWSIESVAEVLTLPLP